MDTNKLVRMANQIATFFHHEGAEEGAKSTSKHLREFWDPRMRRGILEHLAAGGEGLNPMALAAVQLLSTEKAAVKA